MTTKLLGFGAVILAWVSGTSLVYAGGTADLDVQSERDSFSNSGTISGTQRVLGGGGNQTIGQRVIAPTLTYKMRYRSKHNSYHNDGTIKGGQTILGGVGNQAVGQDVVQ